MEMLRPRFVLDIACSHSRQSDLSSIFLPRMQSDANLSLQIKLAYHVPMREIEIETQAKAPYVSLSNIFELTKFSDDSLMLLTNSFLTS